MKITFIMPADDLTGGNRVVGTYAKHLQERGHEVLVVSNAAHRPTWREHLRALREGRWREHRASTRPTPGHIALSGVRHKVLERPRPITADDLPDADVVVATWWETAEWMQQLPAAKGRKVHLIQGYEVWTGESVRGRVRAALRLPNRKIAISAALAREIESELGDLDIAVVPNAVDLVQFDAPPRPRSAPPTVGFIYAHARFKGADICIAACEIARRSVPDLRIIAFGADRPSRDLPLPAGTQYFHRPAQQQIPSLYASCDAWLFGSRVDSFGLPILEAMGCRTPVIGVPVGAAPELLPDGGGILVPGESPEPMAQAIVSLCRRSQARWRRASEQAHVRAHRYSWRDATEHLLHAIATRDHR